MSNVWFITGAGRGLGIDIAQSALAAGHHVVATGRDPKKVLDAIGEHENLLTVALDITDQDAADAAAQAAVDRFGRIDVLVNNAGNFYAGYFENTSPSSSGLRWRRTSSAQPTSPAPSSQSCASSAPVRSSPSRAPPA